MIFISVYSIDLIAAASNVEVVFAPKKFHASLTGQTHSSKFNISQPQLSPGRLIVTSGFYPHPKEDPVTGKIVIHRFAEPGTYNVILTVTDNKDGRFLIKLLEVY